MARTALWTRDLWILRQAPPNHWLGHTTSGRNIHYFLSGFSQKRTSEEDADKDNKEPPRKKEKLMEPPNKANKFGLKRKTLSHKNK